jgi:hypothetical protein
MAKKIHTVWRLLLGSFITLLGFTACKTSKKAQQGDGTLVLYGPPPVQVEKEPIDKVRLLYGVPPIKVEKEPAVK